MAFRITSPWSVFSTASPGVTFWITGWQAPGDQRHILTQGTPYITAGSTSYLMSLLGCYCSRFERLFSLTIKLRLVAYLAPRRNFHHEFFSGIRSPDQSIAWWISLPILRSRPLNVAMDHIQISGFKKIEGVQLHNAYTRRCVQHICKKLQCAYTYWYSELVSLFL